MNLDRKRETFTCCMLSEQHAAEIRIIRNGLLTRGSVAVFDIAGQQSACRHFMCFSHLSNSTVKAQSRHCRVEVEYKHGLCRLVGHVNRFKDGENLLVDILLTPLPEQNAPREHWARFFLASGRMLIGEREHLFAPAHSGAVLMNGCDLKEWVEGGVFFGNAQGRTVACCCNPEASVLYWNGKCFLLKTEKWGPHGLWTADGKLSMVLNGPLIQQKEKGGVIWSCGHYNGEVQTLSHDMIPVHRITGLIKER